MRSAGCSMQSEIRKMGERIVQQFRPAQVILFGSHARGEAGPDSDVDLLVVMDCKGSKREKQLAIRLALHEFRIAKDIVVTMPEELAWRKEIRGHDRATRGPRGQGTLCASP
jgi:uncharacterized protein